MPMSSLVNTKTDLELRSSVLFWLMTYSICNRCLNNVLKTPSLKSCIWSTVSIWYTLQLNTPRTSANVFFGIYLVSESHNKDRTSLMNVCTYQWELLQIVLWCGPFDWQALLVDGIAGCADLIMKVHVNLCESCWHIGNQLNACKLRFCYMVCIIKSLTAHTQV